MAASDRPASQLCGGSCRPAWSRGIAGGKRLDRLRRVSVNGNAAQDAPLTQTEAYVPDLSKSPASLAESVAKGEGNGRYFHSRHLHSVLYRRRLPPHKAARRRQPAD